MIHDSAITTYKNPERAPWALGAVLGDYVFTTDPRLSDARAPLPHAHPESDIANLPGDLAACEKLANKAKPGGYADLNFSGLIAPSALPTGTDGQVLARTASGLAVAFQDVTKDRAWYRHAGTTPFERWYGNSHDIQSNLATTAPAIDTLFAFPFASGRGGRLDRLAFNVTTAGGAGSVARVGIYTSNATETLLYPDALVVDGGQYDTTITGVKATTIDQPLAPNKLYWLAYLAGVAAPTVRGTTASGSVTTFLAMDSALGTVLSTGLSVAFAYTALPSTFTAGAAAFGGASAIIAVRYSA